MSVLQAVREAYEREFDSPASILVRAPGRVNLIGEHTDYNDGFVLPMAIDRAMWIALGPRGDRVVRVRSLDFDETARFALDRLERGNSGWAEYLKGVAWSLKGEGYTLRGWEGVLAGDVPRGAGLSSSAALELATARAFAEVSTFAWEPVRMAKVCQRAENEWVGVRCGIMDQLVSAAGQAGHALLIDCRSLETEAVPLPPGTAVVVLDTATRRGLVDSVYNERRERCEAAAKLLGVTALRDVGVAELESRADRLDPVTRRRARHVVTENERTLRAVEAMRRGEPARLGRLMNESHASLRQDFEVSSRELDAVVACARGQEGCYGARMTGAGLGGCAVALVDAGAAGAVTGAAAACYWKATGIRADVYVCAAADGAEVIRRAPPP